MTKSVKKRLTNTVAGPRGGYDFNSNAFVIQPGAFRDVELKKEVLESIRENGEFAVTDWGVEFKIPKKQTRREALQQDADDLEDDDAGNGEGGEGERGELEDGELEKGPKEAQARKLILESVDTPNYPEWASRARALLGDDAPTGNKKVELVEALETIAGDID